MDNNETLNKLKLQATAKRLKTLMKEKGLSTKDLAEALGISPGAVSQWRSGTSKMSREKIEEVAALLETSPLYLSQGYADDGGAGMFPLSPTEATIIRTLREQIPDDEYSYNERHLIGALRNSKRLSPEDVEQLISWADNLPLSEFAKLAQMITSNSQTDDAPTYDKAVQYVTEDGSIITG